MQCKKTEEIAGSQGSPRISSLPGWYSSTSYLIPNRNQRRKAINHWSSIHLWLELPKYWDIVAALPLPNCMTFNNYSASLPPHLFTWKEVYWCLSHPTIFFSSTNKSFCRLFAHFCSHTSPFNPHAGPSPFWHHSFCKHRFQSAKITLPTHHQEQINEMNSDIILLCVFLVHFALSVYLDYKPLRARTCCLVWLVQLWAHCLHINNTNSNDNTGLASLNTHENEAISASIFFFFPFT